jgi:hypothetical protein
MNNVRPLPSRPSPRQLAFDREIQALVAPGLADDLGLDLGARPRPGARPPDYKSYEGMELAVVGCMRHLSVEGRRTLARFASDLEDAEARGLSVLRIHVVTATADSKARA